MTTKPTPVPDSAVANLLSRLQKGRNTRQKGAFGSSRYQKAQRAAKKESVS